MRQFTFVWQVYTCSVLLDHQNDRFPPPGVDAPEAAHFGKEAQPYAAEALNWLKAEVEGKRLWVQLIRRDQYGRIVRSLNAFLAF